MGSHHDDYEWASYAEAIVKRYRRKRSRVNMVELQRDLIKAHRPYMTDNATRERADATLEFLTDVLLGVKPYGTGQRKLV
jgi:hypothetical protein